jgi:uncharacterized protein (DUF2062 family)
MIRRNLKKTSNSQRLEALIIKYKIAPEFLSTNRKMVSRAVFVGIFIAFIPMPLHMLSVLAIASLVNFNIPIALAMCWLSNPFTMPPIYYMEYLTGSFFLGNNPPDVELTLEWFSANIDLVFVNLYVGTAFYSVVGSLIGYWLVNCFWKLSVKRDKNLHRHHRK